MSRICLSGLNKILSKCLFKYVTIFCLRFSVNMWLNAVIYIRIPAPKISEYGKEMQEKQTSTYSVAPDLGCASGFYFDNVTLTSQNSYQPNNKCNYSKSNFYKWSIYSAYNFSGNEKKRILIGLNPHATELIFLTRVLASKMEFFVHSTPCNTPYVHPRLDSILELCWTFPIAITSEYE